MRGRLVPPPFSNKHMQIRARKTFNSKILGCLVRSGMVVTVPEAYGSELIRNELAEKVSLVRAPEKRVTHSEAPMSARGNESPTDEEDRKDGGQERLSSVSLPVRRSRGRTLSLSRGRRE